MGDIGREKERREFVEEPDPAEAPVQEPAVEPVPEAEPVPA